MKRRQTTVDDCGLPADIAAGPDPRIWCPDDLQEQRWWDDELRVQARMSAASRAWRQAGNEWSEANGMRRNGWLALLPPDVRYATRALGRAHIATGGLVPQWEQR